MQIRRFTAPDMRQAMRAVRDELGPDAVILSNRRTADGVEITAAMDYEPSREDEAEVAPRAERSAPTGAPAWDAEPAVARSAAADPELDGMRREMRELRGLLEHQLSRLAWSELERRQPLRTAIVRRLIDVGLRRELASTLAEAVPQGASPAEGWRRALESLARRIPVGGTDILERGGVVAMLGATGVGKTTTVAKLAARFAIRHGPRHVALITTDSYRVGAHEQLRTFGRIIDIPVMIANDASDLRAALEHFGDRRLVLVDTAGMSQRDRRFTEQVRLITNGSPRVRNLLVLSAAAQYQAAREAIRAFEPARLDGFVITKLDETVSLGGTLCAVVEHGAPVAFVSDGQRVPEDIAPASAVNLVRSAVRIAERYRESSVDPSASSARGDAGA